MNFMFLIPNFLTACNLFAGLAGIAMAFEGRIMLACWLVIASVLFDGVDGKIASWLQLESEFGKWFDALSDWIAFGVLPALITVVSVKHHSSGWLKTIAVFYCLSALFRLIRFNLNSKSPAKSSKKKSSIPNKRFFEGLPTTASAAFFSSLYLSFGFDQAPEFLQMALLLALAMLMMSEIRYYNPRVFLIQWVKRASAPQRVFVLAVILGLLWIGFYVPTLFFYVFAIYVISGAADLHKKVDALILKESS